MSTETCTASKKDRRKLRQNSNFDELIQSQFHSENIKFDVDGVPDSKKKIYADLVIDNKPCVLVGNIYTFKILTNNNLHHLRSV